MCPVRNQRDSDHKTAQVIRILDSWQRAGLPRVIVSAFRPAGLVSYISPNNRYYLKIEGSAATRVRHWISAPHMEEEISAAVTDHFSPGFSEEQNLQKDR
jgi:hypothetical protein